ncbi:MAG: site-2 protease family protein [Gemmataceae bacterium]|nr:site-2 protease family protein [Gemmataceae bacterium]
MSVLEESLAPRTSFDLHFRIGDIPVRVHPFFWLSLVILGWGGSPTESSRLPFLLIWTAAAFVSVLVHELGHVLMGRWFGRRGHILLTGFCGLALGSADLPLRRQRILVALAGPAAGFLFGAAFAAGCWLFHPSLALVTLQLVVGLTPTVDVAPRPSPYVSDAVYVVLWINLFWGLVNLLPIWPLDGGKVCLETCEHYRGREGERLGFKISLVVAAAIAVWALIEFLVQRPLIPWLSLGASLFPVLFFGLLALTSWQVLQHLRRWGGDWAAEDDEPRAPWEQDADWWKHGGRPWND